MTTTEGEIWSAIFTTPNESMVWERVGKGINFKVSPQMKVSWAIPNNGHLDIFVSGTDNKLYKTWWTEELGWELGHNWEVVTEESQKFKADGNVVAISRVKGQVEIFATDSEQNIWKNWWS